MSKQIEKAIELAKKTGDRVIVFNGENDENGYVVLPFAEYEKLLSKGENVKGLTQKEMLDNINRDVAEWKNGRSFGFQEANTSSDSEQNSRNTLVKEVDNKVEEDLDITASSAQVDEYEKKFLDGESEEKKSAWNIPSSRKTAAEEIVEEDRHYLEEIPF